MAISLTKEEQTILQEWEKARVRWWVYNPSQLRNLEREARKIYKKLENDN